MGRRLDIFPGAATPSVFAAGAPFWIGYGFVPEPPDSDGATPTTLGRATRFELLVDGRPVEVQSDVERKRKQAVRKVSIATFPDGLPAGWHRFVGRWYDGGKLVLTSDKTIEFVER